MPMEDYLKASLKTYMKVWLALFIKEDDLVFTNSFI